MKQAYPVARLMDVARLFESRSDAALRQMFRIAAANHLPQQWRSGVESLAQQVQLGRAYEDQARRAARRVEWKEARESIRKALETLKPTRTRVRVEFAQPSEGSMDLGAWVIKEARRVARRTSEQIQAKRL